MLCATWYLAISLSIQAAHVSATLLQEQLHGLEEQVSERDIEIEKLQEQLVQLTEDFRYNLKVYAVCVPRSSIDVIRCDAVMWHGCVHYIKDLYFRTLAAIWHLVCCFEFWSTC